MDKTRSGRRALGGDPWDLVEFPNKQRLHHLLSSLVLNALLIHRLELNKKFGSASTLHKNEFPQQWALLSLLKAPRAHHANKNILTFYFRTNHHLGFPLYLFLLKAPLVEAKCCSSHSSNLIILKISSYQLSYVFLLSWASPCRMCF